MGPSLVHADRYFMNRSACSLNTVSLNYMIPFGISAAVSTRVANELGADRAHAAKFAVYLALGLAITEASIVAVFFVLVRSVWGRLFSSEKEVVQYVSDLMPFLAVTTAADSVQGVLSGVARGCGWQEIGAYVNLGAFYGFGVPVGVVSASVFSLGGRGLWIGLMSGLFLQTSILLYLTFTTDWEKQAAAAAYRVISRSAAAESLLEHHP